MPEALTESFCERCGTRYEFAAPTKLNTVRKTRGLITGLKNYIMSQDALSDAVGDAMRSEEETLAAAQLEAFHESFNFCIDCRQYTCTNCWNDGAGRCRSCVPIPGTDDLMERFEATFQAQHPELAEAAMAEEELQRRLGVELWPTSDLAAASNGHADVEWPAEELSPAASAEPEAVPEAAPEPVVAEELEPMLAEVEVPVAEPEPVLADEPEPEPVVAEELEPMLAAVEEPVAAPEPVLAEFEEHPQPALRVLSWEDDTEFELEPEPVVAEELEPEPVVAEELEPEPVVAEELEPEPVVAEEL
ncbi:MAG TPA: hypothetical protein VF013_04380, partial [Candidatus Limnocylindria bacterium]